MGAITREEVASRIRREIDEICDPIVRDALARRVELPALQLRERDYGEPGQHFPCWTVLTDEIGRKEDIASQYEERLRLQFASLDSTLQQLQSQTNALKALQ